MGTVYICSECHEPLDVELMELMPGTSDKGVIISHCENCMREDHAELVKSIIPDTLDELEEYTTLVSGEFNSIIENDPDTRSWLTEIVDGLGTVYSDLKDCIK